MSRRSVPVAGVEARNPRSFFFSAMPCVFRTSASGKHLSGMSHISMASLESGEMTSSSQDDDEERPPPLPLKQKTSTLIVLYRLCTLVLRACEPGAKSYPTSCSAMNCFNRMISTLPYKLTLRPETSLKATRWYHLRPASVTLNSVKNRDISYE